MDATLNSRAPVERGSSARSRSRPLSICVIGSAESPHVLARARIFAEFGHRVSLVSPVPCDPLLAGEGRGVEIVVARSGRGFLRKPVLVVETTRALARQRFDIYHAHYAAEYGAWIAALCRCHPLVVSVMGGDVLFREQGSLGPLGRWLTAHALRCADWVTVKSSHLAGVVASLGVRRERIVEIVWGIDRQLFKPQRSRPPCPWPNVPGGTQLLFSPRMLQPLYHQHLMIDALARLADELPRLHLVLSTFRERPDYRIDLERLVENRRLAHRVHFVAPTDGAGMVRQYGAADAVISLAASDGFPQTILEAMACGVPVVSRSLDHFKPLLEDRRNVIFVGATAAEVADGIRALFNDEVLYRRIRDEGLSTVRQRACLSAQARQVEAAYYRLLGEPI